MTIKKKKEDDISGINTPFGAAAYGMKNIFRIIGDAMSNNIKLFRFVIAMLACAAAAASVKYLLHVFK